MMKKLILPAIACFTLLGQQNLMADVNNPRPSSVARSLDLSAYLKKENYSTEAKAVADFLTKIVFYQDLEDPKHWWVAPFYGVSERNPATLVPIPSTRDMNVTLDTVWWPKIDAWNAATVDPENKPDESNFNGRPSEAAAGYAATEKPATDDSGNAELRQGSKKLLMKSLLNLNKQNRASLEQALIILYTRAGKSIPTQFSDEDLLLYLSQVRNYVTHRLNINVQRGFSDTEYEMLSKYEQSMGVTIATLPLSETDLKVDTIQMTESGVSANGVSVLRAPGDGNRFSASLASVGNKTIPINGAIVSYALDWDGYTGQKESLSGQDITNPGYILLPFSLKGESKHTYSASGLVSCRGVYQYETELGLTFSKYSNSDTTFTPIPSNTTLGVDTNWSCQLTTNATGLEFKALEDLKAAKSDEFLGQFSREVIASKNAKEALLRSWLVEGKKIFFSYLPEHLKRSYWSETKESCWTEIKTYCQNKIFGTCVQEAKKSIPHCSTTVEWYESYTREVIPLQYKRKERIQDVVNTEATYPIDATNEYSVQPALSTGLCLYGIPNEMDQNTFRWKACTSRDEFNKANDNRETETRNGRGRDK